MRQAKSVVKGVVPFGYLEDKVTLDPIEAAALRDAARWIIEENRIPHFCAEQFNSRGLRTRQGQQFRGDRLTKMLKNPRYAGIVVHHGVQTDEVAPWAPVFDVPTWQALQARLLRPGIAAEVHPQAIYLGTGLARCGVCGRHMGGKMTPQEGPKYTCTSKYDRNRVHDGLRHPRINLQYVDDAIVDGVFSVLRQHGTRLTDTTSSIGAINYTIGMLKSAKESSLGLIHDPNNGMTIADVGMRLRGFEQEIAVLEAERDDLLLQSALDRLDASTRETFDQSWSTISLEEQRRIVRRILVVTVYNGFGPGRVHVEALNA